jgi:CYTH domain-containing protein
MEEEDEDETPEWLGPAIPKEMKYNESHLERQYSNCMAI